MNNDTIEPLIFDERWTFITERSVPNVKENTYLVSDRGRVYSYLRNRILKLVETGNGYFRVALTRKDNTTRYYLIHRIVMIEFNCIDTYKSMQVNHFNGIKSNNNLWNLEWNTASENISHAYRTGLKTKAKGEDCSYATITNEQADRIGLMLSEKKYTHQEIANIIGCSLSVVSDISSCCNWKSVCEKYKLAEIKKAFVLRLTDDQLHALCKYWEDNKDKNYRTNSDLFRESLMNVLGIEYKPSMSATLSRLYNKQTRFDIVSLYNF